jgi:hypothetical protein
VGAAIRVGVQEPDIKALPFGDKVSGTSTHSGMRAIPYQKRTFVRQVRA